MKPTIKKVIAFLETQILSCENSAQEYIQELDNQESGDIELAKAQAFQEVLKFINNDQED